MARGFLVRVRCFVAVDRVAVRCRETRLYHEFGSCALLRETRTYAQQRTAHAVAHARDIDALVARMRVERVDTESMRVLPKGTMRMSANQDTSKLE